MEQFWDEHSGHGFSYDRSLNFSAAGSNDEDEYGMPKKKATRDPLSHRIIEKRRRDRMNNCLADLSRLIPSSYLIKGRRIEKTEIIEMAIKHLRHLQAHACKDSEKCEIAHEIESGGSSSTEQFQLGYQECMSEAMRFMVEVEGHFSGDPLCIRLATHLQRHRDKVMQAGRLSFPRSQQCSNDASSSSNSSDANHTQATPNHDVSKPVPAMDYITVKEEWNQSGHSDNETPQPNSLSIDVDHGGLSPRSAPEVPSSHLRRMLQVGMGPRSASCEDVTNDSMTNGSDNVPRILLTSPRESPPPSYKFKNSIKRRFQQGQGSPTTTPSSKHTTPIFALHPQGTYYIPMTLDSDILAPGMPSDESCCMPPLHPVTISVAWCHQDAASPSHQSLTTSIQVTIPNWAAPLLDHR